MKQNFYKISEEDLLSLLSERDELSELECAGVDNWCGYEEVDWQALEECEYDLSDYELIEGETK